MRRTTLALAAALLAGASACSSNPAPAAAPAAPPAAAAPSSTTPAAPTTAPAASAPAADAANVTAALTKKVPSVKLTVTYDATTDPNGKLGRPHQYVSKTAFDDTRVSGLPKAQEDASKGRRDSISYGGTVETFATAEDAQAWADYVDKGQAALGGMLTPDYIVRKGTVVIRVSHLLTAAQAAEYEKALG